MNNTLVGADQALRLAQLLKEQQPQGRMVGNMYLAPGIGDYLSYGMDIYDATRGQKEAAQEQAANAKSAVEAMNQYGIQAPESLIRQMQPRKAGFERLIGLVRGDNAPEPYQQNIVQNPTQQQREGALLSLIGSNPELASNLMSFEKIKMANAKEAEQERLKGVPTGFRLNEQNQLVPMPIVGGGDYAQFSLERALAGQQFVNPVEAQNMQMQQAKYALDVQAAKRAEESAQRAQRKELREEQQAAEGKDVPVTQLSAQIENFNTINQIDKAIEAVKNNPESFGAKNYLPSAVTQRVDPQGVDARGRVAEIGAVKLHDLSGAAVSASEAPRFQPFLPSATDSPDKIIQNLTKMKESILGMESERNNMYSDGWKKQLKPLERFKQLEQSTAIPSQSEIEAEINRRGRK